MEEEQKKKNYFPIIAIITIIIVIIGATFAYFSSTDTFTNVFQSQSYSAQVQETFESPSGWTPGTTTPKVVTVKNTGNVCEHARVSISEQWRDSNNNVISGTQNGTQAAIINFSNPNDWVKQGNYYYYNKNINSNQTTSSFIESVTFNPAITNEYTCTTSGNTHTCTPSNNSYVNV